MKFDFVFRPVLMLMLLNCLITSIARAQDLEKLTPPTPEVASLLKDFNIPVGYYTGVPDISIPLADLSIKGVSFPVQLSYNASGNRVEEIASFVGLGWNVSGMPFISRSILDKPDGQKPGILQLYNGKTWSEHMADYDSRFMLKPFIYEAELDTEADVYNFSLVGKSGKFWWDYVEQRYVVSPHYNIKIDYPSVDGPIVITDEDGTVYNFHDIEYNSSSATSTAVSWRITGIVNYEKTDSIVFGYTYAGIQRYVYNNKFKDYLFSCDNSPVSYISLGNNYSIYSVRNSKEQIYFEQDSALRKDLKGDGGRLKYIHRLNFSNDTVQKYELYHNYFQSFENSPACAISAHRTELFFRLRLDSIVNVTDPVIRQSHKFEYNTNIAIPCAVSTAQDFWGGYNGETNNQTLIPTYTNSVFTIGDGAVRTASPAHSQWALLKTMTYPTGGKVNFEYESNRVKATSSTYVTPQNKFSYIDASSHISGNVYSDTFCINNPPNTYINNGHSGGGTFVKFIFDEIGYDWREGMQSSALLYFNGLDSHNSSYSTTISYHFGNYYVPNGCYELKGIFAAPAPESFFFMASYGVLDTVVSQQSGYVGGNRIKKITHLEGTTVAKEMIYDYVDPSTGQSSGDVFSAGYMPKLSIYRCFSPSAIEFDYSLHPMYRLHADPTTADANHSGSYVGYSMVTEINKDTLHTGKSVYKYLHAHDMVDMDYPYSPTISFNEFRGHLKEATHYSFKNNAFYPVQRTINDYLFDERMLSAQYLAFDQYYFNRDPNPYSMFYYQIPGGELYNHHQLKTVLSGTTEINFVEGDSTSYAEKYTKHNYNTLNFILKSTYEINSGLDTLHNFFIRPMSNYASELHNIVDSITNFKLIERNNITALLATNSYKNSKLLNQVVNSYGNDDSLSVPVSQGVKQAYLNEPLRNRVHIDLYDRYGNILEQHLEGNIYHSYIYAYNNKKIVAEVENARKNQIAYTSFEDNHFSGWQLNHPANIYSTKTAFSGNKVYSGEVFKNLPTGDYQLQFAAKGNVTVNGSAVTSNFVKDAKNNYKLYSLTYNGIASIRISADSLDEVRLYPKGASMKSYTWNNAGLLQTIMPDNMESQHFLYDALLRLTHVKDVDDNILSRYCYNVYNQLELCANDQLFYFNETVSQKFVKNNCDNAGTPDTINYIVPAGIFSSAISQADANLKAQQHLTATGQEYANLNAGCTWKNDAITLSYTRSCPTGYVGVPLPFTVPANQFTSTISKNNANQQARNWLHVNGQINANENGTCISSCLTGCAGPNKKCINDVCETGYVMLIDCIYQGPGQYQAWYAYVFSDYSMSTPWAEMSAFTCIEEEPEN